MTDEEKAEEYKESKRLHCIPKERYVLEAQESRLAEIKQAFLAGLKAGRPQWHKVADGDLPKRTDEYLTNIGVLTWDYYGDGRYGWHTELCEHCECMDDVDSDEVVAWCEIPKFKRSNYV